MPYVWCCYIITNIFIRICFSLPTQDIFGRYLTYRNQWNKLIFLVRKIAYAAKLHVHPKWIKLNIVFYAFVLNDCVQVLQCPFFFLHNQIEKCLKVLTICHHLVWHLHACFIVAFYIKPNHYTIQRLSTTLNASFVRSSSNGQFLRWTSAVGMPVSVPESMQVLNLSRQRRSSIIFPYILKKKKMHFMTQFKNKSHQMNVELSFRWWKYKAYDSVVWGLVPN